MAFRHHRWEKNGRLFQDDANPRKFQWTTTTADDENVVTGPESFAPYVWDANTRTMKFGRMELVFHPTHQEVKFEGNVIVPEQKFHMDVDVGQGFEQVTTQGPPSVDVVENDDHAVATLTWNARVPRSNEVIQWTTEIDFRSGNSGRVKQKITSPIALDARVRATNNNVRPFSDTQDKRDVVALQKVNGDANNRIPKTFGTDIGGLRWKWNANEVDDHSVGVTQRGARRQLDVTMNAGTLAPGVEKIISPDTFGPSEITTDSDDGEEENNTTWQNTHDQDGWALGDDGGDRDGGMRFTGLPSNIGDIDTVDTGTKVTYDVHWEDVTSDLTWDWLFVEEDNPATWSTATRPSTRTKTTAVVGDTRATSATTPDQDVDSPELGGTSSPGQEWADTVTPVSGGAVAIVAQYDGGGATRFQIIDSSDLQSGTYEAARLTLVYTVASDPVLTLSDFRIYADA